MTDFETQLALGRRYELAMSNWLQKSAGYGVIPAYDYSGNAGDKAPRLQRNSGKNLVLPDILAARDGELRWFEIKWKEQAGFYRKNQKQTTGIALRLWQDYCEVKRITGLLVYLIFIHQQEQKVVFGELDRLPVLHTYDGSKMSRGGMVFFDFAAMQTLMTYDQLNRYLEPAS